MFLQKICCCLLIMPIAFPIVKAQSISETSLKYAGSFAYQMHASRSADVNIQEAIFATFSSTPIKDTTKAQKPGSVVGATLGGILGGAVGFAGGALIGLYADDCYKHGGESSLFCNFDTGLVVGSTSGAVLLATGVHLGNGRHGSFKNDLLVSVLIGGVGLGTALAAESPTMLFSVPIVQLIGTVYMERKGTSAK